MENKPTTIREYIDAYPPEHQETLNRLHDLIKKICPEAEERMSWDMPTYAYYGNLVHFAVHKSHIGFYPSPTGIEAFQEELKEYKTSKGAAQFPFSKPFPFDLVEKIVRYRTAENERWQEEKKAEKAKKKSEK